jgi:hypothetical protein
MFITYRRTAPTIETTAVNPAGSSDERDLLRIDSEKG